MLKLTADVVKNFRVNHTLFFAVFLAGDPRCRYVTHLMCRAPHVQFLCLKGRSLYKDIPAPFE